MAKSAASFSAQTNLKDRPTLRKAMFPSPVKKSLWQAEIKDEFDSVSSKKHFKKGKTTGEKTISTHIVWEVKRNSNGLQGRSKVREVAGGKQQNFEDSYRKRMLQSLLVVP